MSRRWRQYADVRAWIVGRVLYHPGGTLPAARLAKPPDYLLATELDSQDAQRAQRALRDEGVIAALSGRWYIRNLKLARKIGRPLPPKAIANDA